MPSRRTYLAALVAAGLAGCVGETPGTSESPSDSPTATTAPGTSEPPDVAVEAAAVQYSYHHIENVDWNGIQPADGQFVFVTVDARPADSVPARSAFTLVADGEQYEPTELAHRMPVTIDVPGRAYSVGDDNSEDRGWLAFETPAELDAAPALRLDRDSGPATWELEAETATAPPPVWEWSADAPETVEPESTFEITVTAENVGDGAGTFRGAVNFSYPMYMPKGFAVSLDPGASGADTVEAEIRDAEDGKEIEYGVRTPAGETTVSVTVDGGTATPD
ncbi:hypothetical protein B4589_007440 [Halolamina sp. CBA1230]|uniref:hypothetical protein n=1 Tax=Halolamina sp. CBA1230 TaxID=1853690 RepID=UPI0009A1A2B5|nr:hypothetical protein [Halolamina sp. CBA1230]QKY20217.1 hypothetical protein B4589_007440 [Halolamina sp. CBA1230]